ncbi:MAG: hypothetical protein GC152_09950 [Alphaproteobacteria bacterium]|nr:hypothetical protein [Alphaproteobacteria bacterium]
MPNVDDFPSESGRAASRRRDSDAHDEPLTLNAGDRARDDSDCKGGSRVTFRAISTVGGDGPEPPPDMFDDPSLDEAENLTATDWRRLSRETSRASRICAIFIFAAMLTFWPVLTAVGHLNVVGSLRGWNLIGAYPAWAVIFTIVGPAMIYALGYIVSRQMLMMSAADALAASADRFISPDKTAVFNVRSVGAAVRTQIDQVNAGIDDALIRLASVEAMIRQHVEAIEHAGAAMEGGASAALDRVAAERATLMTLTEQLNAQADDFAVAIAEKAQASIDSFSETNSLAQEAESRLEERLGRLEHIAGRALQSFDALCNALLSSERRMEGSADAIERHAAETRAATEKLNVVANEAADSAARNAVNIGQFAKRASEESIRASEAAIEAARSGAERAAQSAIDAAATESGRVADAVVQAVESMKSATDTTVEAAAEDARRAIEASNRLTDAASRASAAAREASEKVRSAGDEASRSAETALSRTEQAAGKIESRNRQLSDARTALEKENERLEALIDEQRQRADRLADTIARQTERLSRLAEVQLREQEAAARIAEADAARAAMSARQPKSFAPPGLVSKSIKPDDRAAKGEMFGGKDIEKPTGRIKEAVSWRDILNATDEAEPLDLRAADKARRNERRGGDNEQHTDEKRRDENRRDENRRVPDRRQSEDRKGEGRRTNEKKAASTASAAAPGARTSAAGNIEADAVSMIHRLQNFTLNLDRRLYGDPPERLLQQFDKGDRNLFANRLMRLDETDVKRRIRIESGRDDAFATAIQEFLHGFESLLEEATTSETADEDLEAYLSSPLGRVYLLIGATVGYFA